MAISGIETLANEMFGIAFATAHDLMVTCWMASSRPGGRVFHRAQVREAGIGIAATMGAKIELERPPGQNKFNEDVDTATVRELMCQKRARDKKEKPEKIIIIIK